MYSTRNGVKLLTNNIVDIKEIDDNAYSAISSDNVYYDLGNGKMEEADEAILQSEGDYKIVAAQRSGGDKRNVKEK